MKEGVSKKFQSKSKMNPNSKHIQKKDKKPFNKANKKFTSQKQQKNPKFQKKAAQKQYKEEAVEQTEAPSGVPVSRIEALYQKGKKLYEEKEREIHDKKGSRGDSMLMRKIMESGTLADKVSALSIKIKDHPKVCLDPLMKLLGTTKTGSRRKNLLAIDSLKELFLEFLLENKKLNFFSVLVQQKETPTDDELIQFYFEHRMKELYSAYIRILESGLKDDLEFFKDSCTRILGELLKSKPEQESEILSLLVNKFGDKSKKYISTLNKTMLDVLSRHKSMSLVVSKEVENFLNRPNMTNDAIFYALNFLSLLNFNLLNHDTLMYLSKLFFKVFFKLAEIKETENEKIHRTQSILLKALNKIFPLIKELDPASYKAIEEHIDQLFKMSHQCTLRIRIQALILLFQFLKTNSTLPDRFFRVLYEVLFVEELKTNTSCQQFFDVLYSALKDDFSLPRVRAFIKRIIQVAVHSEAPFAISSLLLVARLLQAHAGAISLTKFTDHGKFTNENDEEVFRDAPDEDDRLFNVTEDLKRAPKDNEFLLSKNLEEKERNAGDYDAYKREPLYANAENSLLFEVLLLKEHYHPTVRLYASKLVEGVQRNASLFEYNGNPWLDHSLSNFLDRISFKKPKKAEGKQNQMRLSKLVAPISETFASEENVRADEEYFAKYFQYRVPRKQKKGGEEEYEDDEAGMDAYADKIFEQQLQDNGDFDDDDDDLLDDDDFEGEDEDGEGGFEEEGEENFDDLLENMGEGEDDFEEEF